MNDAAPRAQKPAAAGLGRRAAPRPRGEPAPLGSDRTATSRAELRSPPPVRDPVSLVVDSEEEDEDDDNDLVDWGDGRRRAELRPKPTPPPPELAASTCSGSDEGLAGGTPAAPPACGYLSSWRRGDLRIAADAGPSSPPPPSGGDRAPVGHGDDGPGGRGRHGAGGDVASRNAVPVTPLHQIPYVHGGYAGAAPLLVERPRFAAVLRRLLPSAYDELRGLLRAGRGGGRGGPGGGAGDGSRRADGGGRGVVPRSASGGDLDRLASCPSPTFGRGSGPGAGGRDEEGTALADPVKGESGPGKGGVSGIAGWRGQVSTRGRGWSPSADEALPMLPLPLSLPQRALPRDRAAFPA